MSLVYSMKPNGKFDEERDIEEMFKRKAPFKINCASGPFRIFIAKLKKEGDGFQYVGSVSNCSVEGFYNPSEKKGTIIFVQSQPAVLAK